MADAQSLTAMVDFDCLTADCGKTITFNLMALRERAGQVTCAHCHTPYQFDGDFLRKLEKLRVLVAAVQDAGDILGDCNVVINVPAGEVRIPYRLMLTRMTTLITLQVGERRIDFNFRVEPLTASIT